ncbi:hypothetical protein [Hydrogenophaga sp. RWCD_12]|uniref:hypothetical protein n=1 Tax=Hydrogenophaga sp. RWCD_12 TaxID=3391190 RepID=UPI0039850CE3
MPDFKFHIGIAQLFVGQSGVLSDCGSQGVSYGRGARVSLMDATPVAGNSVRTTHNSSRLVGTVDKVSLESHMKGSLKARTCTGGDKVRKGEKLNAGNAIPREQFESLSIKLAQAASDGLRVIALAPMNYQTGMIDL